MTVDPTITALRETRDAAKFAARAVERMPQISQEWDGFAKRLSSLERELNRHCEAVSPLPELTEKLNQAIKSAGEAAQYADILQEDQKTWKAVAKWSVVFAFAMIIFMCGALTAVQLISNNYFNAYASESFCKQLNGQWGINSKSNQHYCAFFER